MELGYNMDIRDEAIEKNLTRLLNQVYKLLPNREEGKDWIKPLHYIIEEFAGMDKIFVDYHDILFQLQCKLAGLESLCGEDDFEDYRGVIFACMNLIAKLKDLCTETL